MSDIKVSVVMPVYNAQKTVGEALDSLLCQTERDIEIICVDDGSTDNSSNILNDYAAKDKRIKVFHQENLHAGVARNNGLKASRGEYVIFLDADDFSEPDLIEKTYREALETNADIVLFGMDRFNNQSKEYEPAGWYLRKNLVEGNKIFSRKTKADFLFQTTHPGPANKLFSRKFILENKLQFANLKCNEDVSFICAAMALADRITYVDKVLHHYRVNQVTSLTSTIDNYPTEIIKAYEMLYNLFNQKGIYAEIEKSFVNFVVANCVWSINIVHAQAAKMKLYNEAARDSFRDRYLSFEREFYYDPKAYDRLKAAPNIVSCYDKRNRDYSKKGFKTIKGWNEVNEPKVSVIIPIYNTEEYLDECLDSIQNQSLREIEIICIDDGSTDSSLDIVKARAAIDERICIYKEENSGQSVARNMGIENSHGKYVFFADSDDLLDLNALEKTYLYAEDNSLDMVCFDGMAFLDEKLSIEDIKKAALSYYARKCDYNSIYTGKELFRIMQKNNEYIVCPYLYILNKAFVKSKDLKFEEGIIHEDNLFTLQCFLRADRAGYIHEQLYIRRYRQESTVMQKTSFEHVYGKFMCVLKTDDLLKTSNLNDEELEAVINRQKIELRGTREKYLELDDIEKEVINGIDPVQKMLFEAYICDWFKEKRDADIAKENVKRANERVNTAENWSHEIESSTTYKVGRLIMFIPCKAKNMLKKLLHR